MRNKIFAVVIAFAGMSMLTGCNMQLIDTTYSYDRAIIELPNGEVIDGKVQSWKDYEGDQIQVVIDDVTYLVHSENICLINE